MQLSAKDCIGRQKTHSLTGGYGVISRGIQPSVMKGKDEKGGKLKASQMATVTTPASKLETKQDMRDAIFRGSIC